MKIREIIELIEIKFPKETALIDDQEKIGYEVKFDNEAIAKNVIITLDVTPKIIDYAIQNRVSLIITHHPLFYHGLEEEIKQSDLKSEMLSLITRNKITIYAAHTNVDVGKNGLSFKILKKIGLNPNWFLDKETKIGAITYLEPRLSFGEIVELFMNYANLTYIRYLRSKEKNYTKIAFVAGAGASFINQVVKENVELLITSDIPWHVVTQMQTLNLDFIEVSHAIENEFKNIIAALIEDKVQIISVKVPDLTKVYVIPK